MSSEGDALVIGYWKVLTRALPQTGIAEGQKTQLNLEKHGGQIKMLMTVLMNSLSFGQSGNRETQIVPISKEKGEQNRLSDQMRSEKSIDL